MLTAPTNDSTSLEHVDQFKARAYRAYVAGDSARDQGRIRPEAHMVYEWLVRYAGDKPYCWPGEEHLAAKLGVSPSTVKRRMSELVRAGLIIRTRRLNRSSLTYIAAYREEDLCIEASADSRAPAQPTQVEATVEHPDRADGPANHPSRPLFFGLTDDPTVGPNLDPDSLKTQNPESSVGGGSTGDRKRSTLPETATTVELRHEDIAAPCVLNELIVSPTGEIACIAPAVSKARGSDDSGGGAAIAHKRNIPGERNRVRKPVSPNDVPMVGDNAVHALLVFEDVQDPVAVSELQGKPLVELQAISRYLDTQTNVVSRPALFVWLARHNFGTTLLAGHKPRAARRGKARRTPSTLAVNDAHRYLVPAQHTEPGSPELTAVWQGVLDQFSRTLSRSDYETWIAPSTLVALDDGVAVVVTPNIFVKQEVEQRYRGVLEEYLSSACGQPTVLQAVIG